MPKSSKNSQSIWVALSFLILGLFGGLMFAGGLDQKVTPPDSTTPPAQGQALKNLQVVAVSEDDDAVMGSKDAPITLIEFSNFQCHYCEQFFTQVLPQIKENYVDKGLVRIVYRDYPANGFPQALVAAEAAECVGEEGDEAYFKMHDLIFTETAKWSGNPDAAEALALLADTLGVDIRDCLASADQEDEAMADYTAARSYGVRGTPTFFVNGKALIGGQPYEVFDQFFQAELSSLQP